MTLSLVKIILVLFENNFVFVWKLIESSENHLKNHLRPILKLFHAHLQTIFGLFENKIGPICKIKLCLFENKNAYRHK